MDSQRYIFPEFGYALNGDKVYLNKSTFFAIQGGLSNDSHYDGIMPFMSCTDTVIKSSLPINLVQFIHALKEAYGAKALLMFGFYISSLFSHVIFNKYRFFPLLSLYGFPHAYGDDKRFLTRLFNRCLFIDSEGQKIKAAFVADSELKKIRQKSNLVCALLDDRNYKKPFVYDTVLPYYNRNLADLKAPLTFVSSNDTEQFSFEVIKEFLISLHFSNTINSQVKPAWQQLNTYSPEQLASVGNYLLNNRQYFERNLINTITQYQTYLTSSAINLKMAQNYAVALSGIVCFLKLISTPFINTQQATFIQEDINYLEHYTLQRASHKQQSTQNPAYLAEYFLQLVKETDLVKEGIALRENNELQFSTIVHQPDIEIDLPKVLKQLKTHDLEFNQKMLEVELKKHPHFLRIDRSMESGVTRRVFSFDAELANILRLQRMNKI